MKMNNILITGGSTGIGYGLVNKFLDNNYHVFAISRTVHNLEPLKIKGQAITIIKADITNKHDQENILKSIGHTLAPNNKLDIINNAAYGNPSIFKDTTTEEIKLHFETNVIAPLQLFQAILKQHKVDRVLNISSGAATIPLQNLLGYCASKAAIHHAMKCLNLEYPTTKFANLFPGMVDTPLQERWRNMNVSIFPNVNFYIQAKENHKLASVTKISDFIYYVMNQPLNEFAKDWDINTFDELSQY